LMTDPGAFTSKKQSQCTARHAGPLFCKSQSGVSMWRGVFQGEFGKLWPQASVVIKETMESRSDNPQTTTSWVLTPTRGHTPLPSHSPDNTTHKETSTRAIAPNFGSFAVLAPFLYLSLSHITPPSSTGALRPKPAILAFDAASSLHRTCCRGILDR
jgi:hypothetical protein